MIRMSQMHENMVKANIRTAKSLLKEKLPKKDIKYLNEIINKGEVFLKVVSNGRNRKVRRMVRRHKG